MGHLYTYVYLANGSKVLASLTLSILEKRLGDEYFVRARKGVLINRRYIRQYNRLAIVLTNGFIVKIPRRRRNSVWDAFKRV